MAPNGFFFFSDKHTHLRTHWWFAHWLTHSHTIIHPFTQSLTYLFQTFTYLHPKIHLCKDERTLWLTQTFTGRPTQLIKYIWGRVARSGPYTRSKSSNPVRIMNAVWIPHCYFAKVVTWKVFHKEDPTSIFLIKIYICFTYNRNFGCHNPE